MAGRTRGPCTFTWNIRGLQKVQSGVCVPASGKPAEERHEYQGHSIPHDGMEVDAIQSATTARSKGDVNDQNPVASVGPRCVSGHARTCHRTRRCGASRVTASNFRAATTVRADGSRPIAVAIRLRVDPSLSSRGIISQLKGEAEDIWRPYGIQLDWANADVAEPAARGVSFDASVDLRFERARLLEWPRVLGRVVMDPAIPTGEPLHVSFEATESVLARRSTRPRSLAGIVLDRDVARALGRVLAHEIGHVLNGAPGHDRAGLMRATFDAEELAEPDSRPFRLTCSSADLLKSRLPALTGYIREQHGSSARYRAPPSSRA